MDSAEGDMALPVLREGDTCRYVARAGRAAVLVDPAAYFGALREALLQARHRIVICGWDIDGRMRLLGPACKAEDGAPETLRDFLCYLVEHRPDLRIDVLLWDFATLYALDREAFPAINLGWLTPDRINLTLDSTLPAEASQHQKIVIVDGCVAFCGGIDLAIRRWDTPEHQPDQPLRRDPAGQPYEPFHDIQMMVDGAAAEALAEVVDERLKLAGKSDAPSGCQAEPGHDPWPPAVRPDFEDVDVGIALTRPAFDGHAEVREVERLYCRSIASAERFIYIENQYLTAQAIADALVERMSAKPELEVLAVCPLANHGWLERHTMAAGRTAFVRRLEDAGVGDRFAVVTPVVGGDLHVMVHAKLMIVDDRLLRVGSSNLNNRSMGLDSECDLLIEAASRTERQAIRRLRARLLAEHLGKDEDKVARALDEGGSLLRRVRDLSGGPRRLRPIGQDEATSIDLEELRPLMEVADPDHPIASDGLVAPADLGDDSAKDVGGIRGLMRSYGGGAALLLFCVVLALGWRYTPLSGATDVAQAADWIEGWLVAWWSPLLVLAAFIGLGMLIFPVTVLIAVTAALFGPWLGFAYALGGSLISAMLAYLVGWRYGTRIARSLSGPVTDRVHRALGRHGILTVVVLRLLPLAPFTIINLLAGASRISFRDFVMGTFLGMAPGIAVMTVVGYSLGNLWRAPDTEALLWVVGALGLAAVWTLAVHRFLARRARAQES